MSLRRVAATSPPLRADSVLVPPSRASRLSVSRSRGLIAAIDRPPSCCSLRQGHHTDGQIVNLIGRKGILLPESLRLKGPYRTSRGERGDVRDGVSVEPPVPVI